MPVRGDGDYFAKESWIRVWGEWVLRTFSGELEFAAMVPHRPPLSKTGEVARSAGGGAACTSGSWGAPSPGFAGTSPMLRIGEES